MKVVDEGDDWIVVDKPAPLLIHPSKPGGPATLWDELRELLSYELVNGGQVSIINRLDRETSGLVLIAKNREAASHFCREMQARRVRKRYLLLVEGWPEKDVFEVDAPLLRQGEITDSRIWLKRMAHPQGAPSQTRFRVMNRLRQEMSRLPFTLLEAEPLTGRMHQIRVHAAHAGHSVVGDKIYGPDEAVYLRFIETGFTDDLRKIVLLPRHALHSSYLATTDLQGNLHEWRSRFPREILRDLSIRI